MPECVFRQQFAIVAVMGDGMRTRADQRHVAAQDIEKLRQFVNAGGAQQAAEPRDARVMPGRLGDAVAFFHHGHRTKLENREPFCIEATPLLPE